MRRILTILFCLVLILSCTFTASAAAAEVRSLKADIVVSDDGEYNLTLELTLQFLSSPKEVCIPLAADADDINVTGAEYDTESISGIDCVILESDHGFSGEMSFTISCTVSESVQNLENGTQLFTLKLPELGWEYPIAQYEADITFPAEITEQPSWYSAYHGVDIENYLDIAIRPDGMHIRSFEKLKDRETIQMELEFAPNSFSLYHLPGQTVSFATVLFWIIAALTVAYALLRFRRKRMSPTVRHTPFNDATAGELPCQLCGRKSDIVGIVAHWGNLGYLSITRSRNGRIKLHKQMEMGSERSALERKLFYSIFRSSDSIDASNPHLQRVAARIGILLLHSWEQRMFYKSAPSPKLLRLLVLAASAVASLMTFDLILPANLLRWFLLPILMGFGVVLSMLLWQTCHNYYIRRKYLGIVAALILLVLSAFAGSFFIMLCSVALNIGCAVLTVFGGRRTKVGEDLVRQILGLRAFLGNAKPERLQSLMAADSQYFYRMLPYAEQLGVAAAFAKSCDRLLSEPCPWLVDSLVEAHNASDFAAAYAQIAAAIRNEQPLSMEVIYG